MCKRFIEFSRKDGGIIVQARDEIERVSTGDECYLLHLFRTEHRSWLPIELALTKENLKTIRFLTERPNCCCENNGKVS